MTTFKVEIYWQDAWQNETAYVREAKTRAGFERPWSPVAGVGECRIVLDNATKRFSPDNSEGALYGFLTPGREVKVSAGTEVIWRGYIENLDPDPGELEHRCTVLTCLDGMAQLAKQQVGVVHEDSKAVDDAVSDVVSAAYTPPATDYGDTGDTLEHYGQTWKPETTTCLDALREISEAVYGRFFIQRDGTATFRTRNEEQDASTASALILGAGYSSQVLDTQPEHLVAYWPLWEDSGATANDQSGNERDGTVTGATWGADGIGDERTALSFDGDDYVEIYSAGLASAFDGDEGTLLVWAKIDTAEWTDGQRRFLLRLTADVSNNSLWIEKLDGANGVRLRRIAGGVSDYVQVDTGGETGWNCYALVWSKAADTLKAFVNGSQVGSTQTGLGSWSGALIDDYTAIGVSRFSTTLLPFIGDLAHVAVWGVALGDSAIEGLAAVSGGEFASAMTASVAGEELVNAVQVTVYPAETVGAPQDIWQARTTLRVAPGQGRVVAALFRDENGERCGAVDVVEPVANTDYTVEDSNGKDYTTSPKFSIDVETEATRMTITLGNTANKPLYMTLLKVRGKPIRVWDPVVIEQEDSTSQAAYFKRARVFDLAMQSDPHYAESMAEYILDRHADPALAVESVVFQDVQTLNGVDLWSLDLFDLVQISDAQTGLNLVKHWIRGLEYFLYGGRSKITLHLARADQRQYWLLGVSGFGELGETTVLGF
jgi:hypothetical protein